MKKNNLKYIVGAVLIIGIGIWIFGSVSSENLTYYYTPSEIAAQKISDDKETIRVMGIVNKGSVKWTPRETKLVFQITDDNKHFIEVEYVGAKPDMFREGQGIIVEGGFTESGLFNAEVLLVKHNEEYKTTDHTGKKEDYYQTLQN